MAGLATMRSEPFLARQVLLLAFAAFVLLVAFHCWPIDEWLELPYFDPATQTFPWRYAWISKYFVHRYVKYALLACGIGILATALFFRWRPPASGFFRSHAQRWSFVAWCFALVPTVIGLLRRMSPMHCPWEIDVFGGYAPYFDLLAAPPSGIRPGHCFPAAFVASSSWMLAFALLWYPERRRLALGVGIAAMLLSLALGWVQQMRGAHFLSHTLWSLWVSWAVILAVHRISGAWRETAAG
jgi:membrane-associated PAP2 superfamily phosphatase